MNNREIKFRVWDARNKKFNLPHRDYSIYDFTLGTIDFRDDDKYIFQQFTGLKDKNNKEIYEGDILRVKSFEDWFDQIGYYHYMEVKWIQTKFGITDGTGYFYFSEDREIVGNIFENSELLNKQN